MQSSPQTIAKYDPSKDPLIIDFIKARNKSLSELLDEFLKEDGGIEAGKLFLARTLFIHIDYIRAEDLQEFDDSYVDKLPKLNELISYSKVLSNQAKNIEKPSEKIAIACSILARVWLFRYSNTPDQDKHYASLSHDLETELYVTFYDNEYQPNEILPFLEYATRQSDPYVKEKFTFISEGTVPNSLNPYLLNETEQKSEKMQTYLIELIKKGNLSALRHFILINFEELRD